MTKGQSERSETPRPARELPAEVTMPLLDRITNQALDQEYRFAAERHQPRDGAKTRRFQPPTSKRYLTIAGLLVFGLMVAIAAVQTDRDADNVEAGRQLLVSRIQERQGVLSDLRSQVSDLTVANTERDAKYAEVREELDDAQERTEELREVTAFVEQSGSGVHVTLDNAPGASYVNRDPGVVQHGDLAELVNGFWEAGATAIAVDGQRLTALSAFSNAGPVVRVNGISLSPPYEVVVLGDTGTLQANFATTVSGDVFHQITTKLDMPVKMQNMDDLKVPAAPSSMMSLGHAQVIGGKDDHS